MRREKALSSSGCEPRPATVAPAGSNRSNGGGNESVEAFGVEGPLRDSAIVQAVTRVNVEQASKSTMRKPTRLKHGEGCHRCGKRAKSDPTDSAGVVTMACTKEEDSGNTGSPVVWPCARPTGAPRGAESGTAGWRMGAYYR